MKRRRRKSDFNWGEFFAVLGTVALFTAAGFIWGVNVGVQFG